MSNSNPPQQQQRSRYHPNAPHPSQPSMPPPRQIIPPPAIDASAQALPQRGMPPPPQRIVSPAAMNTHPQALSQAQMNLLEYTSSSHREPIMPPPRQIVPPATIHASAQPLYPQWMPPPQPIMNAHVQAQAPYQRGMPPPQWIISPEAMNAQAQAPYQREMPPPQLIISPPAMNTNAHAHAHAQVQALHAQALHAQAHALHAQAMSQARMRIRQYTRSLFHEGYLNGEFNRIRELQDESCPNFVIDLFAQFFNAFPQLVEEMALALEQEVVDFNKVQVIVARLLSGSVSLGAAKIKSLCVSLITCCKAEDRDGCMNYLEAVKHESFMLKYKLQHLFGMEQEFVYYGGSLK